jgi:hypothetical protein
VHWINWAIISPRICCSVKCFPPIVFEDYKTVGVDTTIGGKTADHIDGTVGNCPIHQSRIQLPRFLRETESVMALKARVAVGARMELGIKRRSQQHGLAR